MTIRYCPFLTMLSLWVGGVWLSPDLVFALEEPAIEESSQNETLFLSFPVTESSTGSETIATERILFSPLSVSQAISTEVEAPGEWAATTPPIDFAELTLIVLPKFDRLMAVLSDPSEAELASLPLDATISTSATDLQGAPHELSLPTIQFLSLPELSQATDETEAPTEVPADGDTPTAPEASPESGGGNLAQQAQNPIANLISIPFQHNVNFNVGPFDQTQYVLNVQPVIPVELSDDWLLVSRIITPLILQPTVDMDTVETNGTVTPVLEPGGSIFGLGDINPSFFFVPQTESNITWGIGPVFLLPTATDDVLGTDRWSAGPTGVVVVTSGNWLYGVLANQIWSFAGDEDRPEVSQFFVQPFVNYSLPQGWTIGSAPSITANWNADDDNKWTVPVGLTVSKLVVLGQQPLQLTLGGFYNVVRPDNGADWTLRFQTTLLFPTGG